MVRTRFDARGPHGLATGDARRIAASLRRGELCIVPSDTCYSLAAMPWAPGVTADIDRALERDGEPISLAFPSYRQIGATVKLDRTGGSLLEVFTPGPLTVVLPPRREQDAERNRAVLFSRGDVGARLPDSAIERQVALELGTAVTTIAIRNGGEPIRDPDEAIEEVARRFAVAGCARAFDVVDAGYVASADVSTVLDFGGPPSAGWPFDLKREGAISERKLQDWKRRGRTTGVRWRRPGT